MQRFQISDGKLTERMRRIYGFLMYLITAADIIADFQPVFRVDSVSFTFYKLSIKRRVNKKL